MFAIVETYNFAVRNFKLGRVASLYGVRGTGEKWKRIRQLFELQIVEKQNWFVLERDTAPVRYSITIINFAY